MAAPAYVPVKAIDDTRIYTSPPRRPESWIAQRPSELPAGQERGPGLGSPGPDQGFALTLAELLRGDLRLRPGEDEDDAVAGCVAVALKRASLFGRAPVIHDLRIAFTLWGFLDEDADDELVALRRPRFEGVAHAHHYAERRAIADAVPDAALRLTPEQVRSEYGVGWRELLDL